MEDLLHLKIQVATELLGWSIEQTKEDGEEEIGTQEWVIKPTSWSALPVWDPVHNLNHAFMIVEAITAQDHYWHIHCYSVGASVSLHAYGGDKPDSRLFVESGKTVGEAILRAGHHYLHRVR